MEHSNNGINVLQDTDLDVTSKLCVISLLKSQLTMALC